MRNKLNIIIGNAPIHNGNRGCVALSISTMFILDKILNDNNLDYCLYLCDSSLDNEGEYIYDYIDKQIIYNTVQNIQPVSTIDKVKSIVKQIIRNKKYCKSKQIMSQADFIFDIGQGDSFSDIYGKERFKIIDRIHKFARKFHIPYCFLPQTIGPFTDLTICNEALESINNASWVMTRDRQSYDYVKEIASEHKNIREYIDVAFFLPYKRATFDGNYIHVGLNISALLWNGGYLGNNQFGLKVDYQHLIHSIIKMFLSMPTVVLHLIPHVVVQERHVENDYAVAYDIQQEYNNERIVLSPFFLGPIEAKNYISGMDFFMGARMHATIAAFSSCTPVVPMAYSRKFNGLFEDTLDYHYMVDLKVDTEMHILDLIKQGFKNRKMMRRAEEKQMKSTVPEAFRNLSDDIAVFLKINK